MLSAEQNERLTRVGPGTPAGELLRRYWHPVATSAQLADRPVRAVRILGESLTLFRGGGLLGLVGQRCAHRGVDLSSGLPEERGLRCPYHGWLYDTQGQCLEQPPEDPTSNFPSKIKLPSYPVRELGGLVWAYLGPLPAPALPRWDLLVEDNKFRQIGLTTLPCNWLQCQENSMDTVHVEYLHGHLGRYALERKGITDALAWELVENLSRRHRQIRFEPSEYGFQKYRLRDGEDEATAAGWNIGHPLIFPNMVVIGAPGRREMQIRVPVDDTTTWHLAYQVFEPVAGARVERQMTVPTFDVPIEDLPHYILGQDVYTWPKQGEIVDRTKEHLTPTDHGIIMFRRLLDEQIELVESGRAPMNFFPSDSDPVLQPTLEPYGPLTSVEQDLLRLAAGQRTPVEDVFPSLLGVGGQPA